MVCQGHGVLEMPSGTGKTITLLSLIVAYQQSSVNNRSRQLIYCSRTVQEIEKALAELQRLIEYREQVLQKKEEFIALGLSSRKNLCINPDVNYERNGAILDAKCMSLTASWIRETSRDAGGGGNEPRKTCAFYETLVHSPEMSQLAPGVYTIQDLKEFGEQQGLCPYFLARRTIKVANVVIYSFHYLLDPKVAQLVSKEVRKDSIVVFDEAHNIDNVCIESMSIDLNRNILESSLNGLNALSDRIQRLKETNKQKLENEYKQLVKGLLDSRQNRESDLIMANPVLPDDLLKESVPGNIRKAEHFVAFLKRFIEYLKIKLKSRHVYSETCLSFMLGLKDSTYIEQKALRFTFERLSSLVRTLEITNLSDFTHLLKVANFATIISNYLEGFLLIMEPFDSITSTVFNPTLHLTCLDASIAIKPIFERFKSVVITSGTLSPLEMYPRILQFHPAILQSLDISFTRNNCFSPLIITRGSDQVAITSKFELRNDPAVVRNYGNILIELCKIIPDGIVAFFPSYIYMESIVALWQEMHVLDKILKHKVIFVETPDAVETSYALENYRKTCDSGRGAILLSVARGKVAEGIDFDNNYGRAVVMIGIPYQYTESRILKARLEYLRHNFQINENDFLTFDAMRQAAQCVGRVIRGKTDYGLMVFADKRFNRQDKRGKLPKWIGSSISEVNSNLSLDVALGQTKKFLREMAQPYDLREKIGESLLREEDLVNRSRNLA